MKVLMVTADHLMIDRRIIQEAKSLIKHGYEVTLLAGFECPVRESYFIDGIRIERFVYDWADSRFSRYAQLLHLKPGTYLNNIVWRIFRYAIARFGFSSFDQFVLDRLLEYQVDIMHVHDYPMLRAGIELARIRKVPLIYDAHELYYAQAQLAPLIRKRYMRRERKWIHSANCVITVNPYIAELMMNRYGINLPEVIMNASPLRPRISTKPLRQRFNLNDSVRIVLYQGWISDNRGIDCLIQASEYFDPGIVLVVVGYGEYEAILKALVAEMRLEERVYFYGGVPSDELHALTCDADLGVIPYHGVDENNFYCSPNKLFEFAVAGLPFICNDLPFLRDIVRLYGNGLIADLKSPQGTSDAVNSIFSSLETFNALRIGAENAGKEMNWEAEEYKLLNIYQNI